MSGRNSSELDSHQASALRNALRTDLGTSNEIRNKSKESVSTSEIGRNENLDWSSLDTPMSEIATNSCVSKSWVNSNKEVEDEKARQDKRRRN